MTIGSVRSGLIETSHPVSAVALDAEGSVIASLGGDLDREFFLRSSPKPLQAAVMQRLGADLEPAQLAIASASHSGFPVHVAYVVDMLDAVGLDTGALLCPPSRPMADEADRVWAAAGRSEPESVFHNCSGKHAGMLRACVAQGWSLEYTDPDHPLQQEIFRVASDVSGRSVEPTGVDGCGIPTLRSDVTGLARIFSALVNDSAYAEVSDAASRFVALTADGTRPEARLARWLPVVTKGGAEGCIGLGMLEHGIALGVKSWTGRAGVAELALLELMNRLGLVPAHQLEQLAPVARPHVFGGGQPVGSLTLLDV